MSKGSNERANEAGEAFLKGRRAGQTGTHGQARKGVVEKTVISGAECDGGTKDAELKSAASGIYRKAVRNSGDSIGDKALTER